MNNREIFVFGSNLAGVHGAGAAKFALTHHRAAWGIGVGRTGASYAIPTKDERINTLPLNRVASYVQDFLDYAEVHPRLTFKVTRIGCGLAGFQDADIAPLFADATVNCSFDTAWEPWLGPERVYWGHVE